MPGGRGGYDMSGNLYGQNKSSHSFPKPTTPHFSESQVKLAATPMKQGVEGMAELTNVKSTKTTTLMAALTATTAITLGPLLSAPAIAGTVGRAVFSHECVALNHVRGSQ
jgi:hypothetical protein